MYCNESKTGERELLLRVFTEEVKGSDSTMKHVFYSISPLILRVHCHGELARQDQPLPAGA